ncbi:MAG TPA: SPOR domain-containing protein [Candidatus Kapabacteria bacterium]|nr:SPOR domain-containing protein [Candidatus Kapabacteria bacterium]
MKTFVIAIMIILTSFPVLVQSQTEKVKQYLKMIGIGKINDVKSRMPDMLAIYPNDPGVMLLHGIVIEDMSKSIEIFEKIIKNFPESEFADDANYRIIQYYILNGNTAKANKELETFRSKYKDSELLIIASDLVNTATKVVETKNENIAKEEKKSNVEKKENGKKEVETKKAKEEKPAELKSVYKSNNEEAKPQEKSKNGKTVYGLQVGLYSNYDAAKSEMEKFQKQRMFAEIKQKKVDNNNYYAVIIGNYSSKESAEEAKIMVKNICKCDPIIFEKEK